MTNVTAIHKYGLYLIVTLDKSKNMCFHYISFVHINSPKGIQIEKQKNAEIIYLLNEISQLKLTLN